MAAAEVLGLVMVGGFFGHVGFPNHSRISRIAGLVMVVFFVAAIVAGAIHEAQARGCECGGG
jgi:uncharacterized membrane protein (UPF0136 family)